MDGGGKRGGGCQSVEPHYFQVMLKSWQTSEEIVCVCVCVSMCVLGGGDLWCLDLWCLAMIKLALLTQ